MKKLLMIAAMIAVMSGCGNNDQGYTINGNINGIEGTVVLMNEFGEPVAEAPANNGKFKLKGSVEEPGLYFLAVNEEPFAMIVLENAKINVKGDAGALNSIEASGTIANDRMAEFSRNRNALVEKFYEAEDESERSEIIEEDSRMTEEAIDKNLDNFFGLYLLAEAVDSWEATRTLKKMNEFSLDLQRTGLAEEIREEAEARRRIEIGQPYTEITLPDSNGKELSLSSYIGKGKYVLLDFWASWCGPCMMEIPYLVDTYKKYNRKGFEIYGVSLDLDRDSWLGAIKDNGMNWVQVIAADKPGSQDATNYSVKTIPANFLFGPDGTIIAKNLRGDEVERTLEELLGK